VFLLANQVSEELKRRLISSPLQEDILQKGIQTPSNVQYQMYFEVHITLINSNEDMILVRDQGVCFF